MAQDKNAVRKVLDKAKAEKRDSLTAPEGKLVCDAYGITVPKEGVARSAQEAGSLAQSMGFPVVLKIVSPDILHKTEAGGVVVGVNVHAASRRDRGRAGGLQSVAHLVLAGGAGLRAARPHDRLGPTGVPVRA